MKAYTAIFLAASASLLNAQDLGDQTAQYIQQVCLPNNATGYPDLNAPCNAIQAIFAECTFGPSSLADFLSEEASANSGNSDGSDDYAGDVDDGKYPMQSNATQRTCICESQWFALTNACLACYQKHGLPAEDDLSPKQVSSISSAYCAASATPTLGFAYFIYQYAPGVTGTSLPASSTATPSSFSDPLGNRTEVSLYYTPSVTGSAAWAIAEATGTSSGLATFTTTRTSNGQIVATATNGGGSNGAATGAASSTTRNANSTTTTAPNSAHTHGAAVVAGLIGVAGLLAML
ncbi:Hypothetical predicted protein [Lecanosticta acicola]|uniref:Uncharacterized protein n=1 Tax=Lecanosticta acicola TaxID=111012 RepID=A0AAI8Z084_9PEZI|nr:Hypothetical predicted protein [Lecanosticta acicola]